MSAWRTNASVTQSAVWRQTLHPLLWNSAFMSESQTYSEGRADLGNLLSPQSSVRGLLRAGAARHISAGAAAGWGPAGSGIGAVLEQMFSFCSSHFWIHPWFCSCIFSLGLCQNSPWHLWGLSSKHPIPSCPKGSVPPLPSKCLPHGYWVWKGDFPGAGGLCLLWNAFCEEMM